MNDYCAHCGTRLDYLPHGCTRIRGDRAYCSDVCADLGYVPTKAEIEQQKFADLEAALIAATVEATDTCPAIGMLIDYCEEAEGLAPHESNIAFRDALEHVKATAELVRKENEALRRWKHRKVHILEAENARLKGQIKFQAGEQKAAPAYCRPEVVFFAHAMEYKLRLNDKKKGTSGWRGDRPMALFTRVHEEVEETFDALKAYLQAMQAEGRDPNGPNEEMLTDLRAKLRNEAADVGNMLMMILDVCGCPSVRSAEITAADYPKCDYCGAPANGWNGQGTYDCGNCDKGRNKKVAP